RELLEIGSKNPVTRWPNEVILTGGEKMRRRMKIIVAAALLALVATVAGATAKPARDPGISSNSILIGGTFPESGEASMYGVIPKAETAYFDWFNAHSSVNGRKINFKYYDDQYDP